MTMAQGLSMIMPYSLRSMGSGPVPDGPELLTSGNQLKPFIIVVLCSFCFNNFAENSILRTPGAIHDHALLLEVYGVLTCPRWSWPPETNSNHYLLLFPYSFCFNNFAENSILRTPGAIHDHALLFEVYGVWTCPRWSWPPETNSNHS